VTRQPGPGSLWRDRGFTVFLTAQTLSVAGDSFALIAVPLLGVTGSVPPTAVLAALYLGCISVAGISSMSLRQEVTPDHLLGRVTAAFWAIHFSLGPAGAALLTWAACHFGVLSACVASGATCLIIATATLATPIRSRAERPVRP
jgi:hypothetical protein